MTDLLSDPEQETIGFPKSQENRPIYDTDPAFENEKPELDIAGDLPAISDDPANQKTDPSVQLFLEDVLAAIEEFPKPMVVETPGSNNEATQEDIDWAIQIGNDIESNPHSPWREYVYNRVPDVENDWRYKYHRLFSMGPVANVRKKRHSMPKQHELRRQSNSLFERRREGDDWDLLSFVSI